MNNKNLKTLHGLMHSASCSAQRIEELAQLMMDRDRSNGSLYTDDHDLKDIVQTAEMLRDVYAEVISIAKQSK